MRAGVCSGDVSGLSGAWRVETRQPAASNEPRTLTIDATAQRVVVTATWVGGVAGMRTAVQRYELDGIERPADVDAPGPPISMRCRRLDDPEGFEVSRRTTRVIRGVQTTLRTTERWTLSGSGRLVIEAREERPAGETRRRVYVRR